MIAKRVDLLARKPSREDLRLAVDGTVPDVIAPGLRVLFCGINPSLYTAAVGYHFARPGNRFWPALQASGFTDRLLSPHEEHELLALGYGITNVVARATARADELFPTELVTGGRDLELKVRHFSPRVVAVLGISAYRVAFGRSKAVLGPQSDRIGNSLVWVLPNPSGLNAHFQIGALARLFREMRTAASRFK